MSVEPICFLPEVLEQRDALAADVARQDKLATVDAMIKEIELWLAAYPEVIAEWSVKRDELYAKYGFGE